MKISELRKKSARQLSKIPKGWHTVRQLAEHQGVDIGSVHKWIRNSPVKIRRKKYHVQTESGVFPIVHYQIDLD